MSKTVSKRFEVKKQGSTCTECGERIRLNDWACYYGSGNDRSIIHAVCAPQTGADPYQPLPEPVRARNVERLCEARTILEQQKDPE